MYFDVKLHSYISVQYLLRVSLGVFEVQPWNKKERYLVLFYILLVLISSFADFTLLNDHEWISRILNGCNWWFSLGLRVRWDYGVFTVLIFFRKTASVLTFTLCFTNYDTYNLVLQSIEWYRLDPWYQVSTMILNSDKHITDPYAYLTSKRYFTSCNISERSVCQINCDSWTSVKCKRGWKSWKIRLFASPWHESWTEILIKSICTNTEWNVWKHSSLVFAGEITIIHITH